jgi:anti-anti-sigma factor
MDHALRPAGAAFALDVSVEDDSWTVAVSGDLDCTTAERLRACLQALHQQHSTTVVDLEHVDFIDSAGLGVLVAAQRAAGRSGQDFVVRSPSRAVRKVVDLASVEEITKVAT